MSEDAKDVWMALVSAISLIIGGIWVPPWVWHVLDADVQWWAKPLVVTLVFCTIVFIVLGLAACVAFKEAMDKWAKR